MSSIPRSRLVRSLASAAIVAGALAGTGPAVGQPPGTSPPEVTPTAGAVEETTFAVFGDYGTNLEAEGEVAEMVDGFAPDFVVTTGDNIYAPGTYESNVGDYYGHYMGGARNRFFPSPGNTDYTDAPNPGIGDYLAFFDLPGPGTTTSGTSGNERYYDVIEGPVHIFLLDSQAILTDPVEATAQKQWLETQLAASTTPWQVVVVHHPPFTSRKQTPYWPEQWPFAAWGADAVFAGHDHSYERFLADGIPYFISGLGGRPPHPFPYPHPNSQVRYNGSRGTMLVGACEIGMRFEFHGFSDGLVDSATIGSPCQSVSGRVFMDEVGEPGIGDVLVTARGAGANGVFDPPGPGRDDVFQSVWTAVDGSYVFPALGAGPYRVLVSDGTLPDPDLVLTVGADPVAVGLGAGEHVTVDFGYQQGS